ncbi:hypothetical protein KZ813_07000 [Sphingomonas sp. RHCKR7]|uniref:hypothetical protein n=1 Tax=Sphingomonas folli TaxID=2862497 RepID=UPI001CA53547|nr:hypothetical protein [Sphingomonas folli]MBW6526583.1 hypothetical protein [Sphingomonas folli]
MPNIQRIYSPPIAGSPPLPAGATSIAKRPDAADAPYLAKLMTMFPAEAVTFYTLGSKAPVNPLLIAMVVLLALIAVRWAAYRSAITHKSNGLAVTVSAVSFVLWVFASADIKLVQTLSAHATAQDVTATQSAAAFLIAVWSWVVPSFVKLDAG